MAKKKKTKWTKKELKYFQDIIFKKRDKLLDELLYLKEASMESTLKDASGDHSTYSFHMADQGTDAMEREKLFLWASRENKFLAYLNEALERIKVNNYGICTECKNLIDKERLEAVPHAKLCVPCKLKLKEQER